MKGTRETFFNLHELNFITGCWQGPMYLFDLKLNQRYGRGAPMRQQDTRDSFKLRHRPGIFRSYKRTIAGEKKRPYELNTVVLYFFQCISACIFVNPEKTCASRQLGMEGSSGVGLTSILFRLGNFKHFIV